MSIYHRDWIMRQIAVMVTSVARILLNKQTPVYEVIDGMNRDSMDELHLDLVMLLREGRINEAENLLFDSVNINDQNCLQVALDFYSRLNEWREEDLIRCGFSREEIQEGLDEILDMFDVDDVLR